MKLSLKWLQEFVEIPTKITPSQLANLITLHTAEVDGYENQSESFNNMVVGKISALSVHPNADKLRLVTVNIGEKNIKVVCGGSNLYENQLVVVGLPGAKVQWHGEGDLITLEPTTIRGEDSYGMICASSEIGLGPSKGTEIMDLTDLNLTPGTPLNTALNKNDIIFDIDNKAITHRPDLWSHYGFAREISVITGGKLKPLPIPNIELPKQGEEINLKIQNPEILKKWTSVIINNVTVQPSPDWLRHKLESIGARSINNIVDITNLVMYEMGQPLHAYDKSLLGNLDLTIRFANENETIETLDHKERELTTQDPILIAQQQKPAIILGIMGGANSEISETTTSILLESACFDPVIIRKSSTAHALRSDASQRFEKSLDPVQCLPALKKAINLILEICPQAKITGPITEISTQETKQLILKLDSKKVNKYIGIELPTTQIIEILQSLEFQVKGTDILEVTVPSFRATKDIQTEVDLIEEVVRIYGFDKIEEILPSLPVKLPYHNLVRSREHQARNILAGLGVSEVLNYSFYSQKDYQNTLQTDSEHLKLQNFLSEEQTHLRTSLVTNLLKTIHLNLKNYPSVKLFEIGRTYKEIGEFFPTEEEKIAITVCGTNQPFFDLKGIIESFLAKFAHQEINLITAVETPSYLHPKKSIQIVNKDNVEIGFAGIVHPLVQENFDLKNEIAYAEINLGLLTHQLAHAKQFAPIPKFPGIEFDLSIVIPEEIFAEQIRSSIKKSSNLIQTVTLFDHYTGNKIPAKHKALAYKIYLQSPDRTLTEEDLSSTREKCISNIKKIGGTIRGSE